MAHRGGHPHVHVIVNRVDAESGKAAGFSRSKLRLFAVGRRLRAGAGVAWQHGEERTHWQRLRPPASWPGPSRDARATW